MKRGQASRQMRLGAFYDYLKSDDADTTPVVVSRLGKVIGTWLPGTTAVLSSSTGSVGRLDDQGEMADPARATRAQAPAGREMAVSLPSTRRLRQQRIDSVLSRAFPQKGRKS